MYSLYADNWSIKRRAPSLENFDVTVKFIEHAGPFELGTTSLLHKYNIYQTNERLDVTRTD